MPHLVAIGKGRGAVVWMKLSSCVLFYIKYIDFFLPFNNNNNNNTRTGTLFMALLLLSIFMLLLTKNNENSYF